MLYRKEWGRKGIHIDLSDYIQLMVAQQIIES